MKKQYEEEADDIIEEKIEEIINVDNNKSRKGIQVFLITFGVSFVILMCVFLLFFILGSSAAREAGAAGNQVPYYSDYKPQEQENINILILGGQKTHLPPTYMLLLKYNAPDGKILLQPLASETLVNKDGESKTLLEWYDYESIRGCIGAVEALLEVDIDRYIRLEEKGIANLVDYLGGIKFDVEKDIYYQGSAVTRGKQMLDGRRVSMILSSSSAQKLQGELFYEYFTQHFNDSFVDKYTKFISAIFYNVETNLNQYDFAIRQRGLFASLTDNTLSIELVE